MNHPSIDSILLKRPYLRLIVGDLYHISKRIKEIEKGYFIVFNSRSQKYEVHSTENGGWNTYCFTVPYDTLDYRTLQLCRETNVRTQGEKILKRMEEHNAKLEKENQKDFDRYLTDAGLETADMVAFGIDRDELHDSYTKTHYMGGGANHDSG